MEPQSQVSRDFWMDIPLVMPVIKESRPLPYYDNPPVVETVLGVQFDRLSGFKNGHLGAFWMSLGADEWPVVEDAPPLPPQFERFDKTARWATGIHLQLTQDPACRLQIKNKKGDRMIQLQNNRLHFNWLGEAGGGYPRYETVRAGFASTLRGFVDFSEQQHVGCFRPNQWEVTYVNQIPQGSIWNTPSDWGFFKPLAGFAAVENLVRGESFGGEWHFVIPDQKGRLHVQWQHGMRPAAEESGIEVVRLTFTARGPIADSDDHQQSIFEGVDLGREIIVSTFKELMSDEANTFWGLQHADNQI